MYSSVSLKDQIWFLRMCHHVPNELYPPPLLPPFRCYGKCQSAQHTFRYRRLWRTGVHVKTMSGRMEGSRGTGLYGGGRGRNVTTIGMCVCVEGEERGRSLGLLSVNSVYDWTNRRPSLKFVGNGTYYFFTTSTIEMVIWRVIKSSVTPFDIQNISWRKKCE